MPDGQPFPPHCEYSGTETEQAAAGVAAETGDDASTGADVTVGV